MRKRLLPVLLLSGMALHVHAAALMIVPSQSAQPYLQVIDRLIAALEGSSYTVNITPASAVNEGVLQQQQLVITLGIHAFEKVLALDTATPTLAAMIPRDSYHALVDSSATDADQRQVSALYLEQPYWRQLHLARQLAPNAKRLGALLGPHTQAHEAELKDLLSVGNWQPMLVPMSENDNPLTVIRRLIANSDLLLTIPDSADFNRNTARWLLTLSLRERIPLIGFSRRYVDAGAVASVYSSPETIADEAAVWAIRWQLNTSGKLPAPRHPALFEISLNEEIARRLGITLPDVDTLRQTLQQESGR